MEKDFYYVKIFEQIIQFLLYGGGILAFIKVSFVTYSTRIFGFVEFYLRRKKVLKHHVFDKIDKLLKLHDVSVAVIDSAKKQIVHDLFKIELIKIKQILRMNIKFILKTSLFEYIRSYGSFKHTSIINLFVGEYIESREHTEERARHIFTKNGYMTQNDFNSLWLLYQEISHDYEITIYEAINLLIEENNCYVLTMKILNQFSMIIEIIYKTIGNKFNRLNGRAHGIVYKGYKIGDQVIKNRTDSGNYVAI